MSPSPDAAAAGDLVRRHAAFVWRVLGHFGVDSDTDREDLSQEAFLVALRRLSEFEGRSSVQTWLYGICRRVAADWRERARVRRDAGQQMAHEPPPSVRTPLYEAEAKQTAELLDRAIAGLDDDKRAVFVLYEIEEMPMADVAEAAGCPLQTAYSRLHAARRSVADAVRKAGGGGGS